MSSDGLGLGGYFGVPAQSPPQVPLSVHSLSAGLCGGEQDPRWQSPP